jgi:AAA+ ATPase superfamily predicted ATPase
MFVNRSSELAQLNAWCDRPGASMALVWGRRRVGKTALIGRCAEGRRAVFYTARGSGLPDELASFATKIPAGLDLGGRRLDLAPFTGWEDVVATLAEAARSEPLLLVLDEYPELATGDPSIDTRLRAVWEEVRGHTNLKILLCGSAVRAMQAVAEYRSPLYGRFDLRLPVHPFQPHEAALLLPDLAPAARAVVWGVCDGIPLYLSWWDQSAGIAENILRLSCLPGSPLWTEGEFILATDGVAGGLAKQVLGAIAAGRSRHSEIVSAVSASRQVSRVLDDLETLRLIERVIPVTDDPQTRSGRTTYRIADNFLAFWLGQLEQYAGEIDRGQGSAVANAVMKRLDNHMGPRYEEAFRIHLRRLVGAGEFGPDAVRVGPFWTRGGVQVEIDAVVLGEHPQTALAVGECKWAEHVSGPALAAQLQERARVLPRIAPNIRYAVCARERVTSPKGVLVVTAKDIFG